MKKIYRMSVFFLQKEKEKQGADSSLDSMIVCRADKTSSRHLFLLPKSFVYTVCHSLSQRQNRISLSKTFFLLVIFLSERKCSVFSLSLFIVIVFPTLSYLSPCLLSDYYSTNKKYRMHRHKPSNSKRRGENSSLLFCTLMGV